MIYEEIINIIALKGLPSTVQCFKKGIPYLVSMNRDKIFEDMENGFDGVELENVRLSEFLELLEDSIDDVSELIGIEFSEDATLIHKIERLIFLTDVFRLSDNQYETSEELYADEFLEYFGTTMGYEIDKLVDTDNLYKFHKYREGKELYMRNSNNESFSRAFTNLLVITGNVKIPSYFSNVSNLQYLNLEYFKNIPFRDMSDEQIAVSILLISILIEEYRLISHYDREEFLLEFTKKIPEDRAINIIRTYTKLNAKYHGEVIV
jgi:hypothetical protein